jgi:ketosteroid isomerase-like protein
MVGIETVNKVLKVYRDAWVNQDPDKILKIFTKDAVYHERILQEPFIGHEEIRRYWQDKVVDEQSDIKFKLLNVYIAGDTVTAEWDASFFNKKKNKRIHITEAAIMQFEGDKIKQIREYWHSEEV